MKKSDNLSQKQISQVAGLGLLAMTVAAIYSEFSVLQKIFDPTNAATTYANVAANIAQIPYAIFGYLVVFIADIIVAWALYILFAKTNKYLSLLTAWVRIIYTVIATCSLFYLAQIPRLLGTPEIESVFGSSQLQTQVFLLLHNFYDAWGIGYVFFGIHLLLLGYLIIKSKFVPKLIGVFVAAAGITYMIDYLGKFLLPNAELEFSLMFGWGELVFMLWLLYRGIRRERSKA